MRTLIRALAMAAVAVLLPATGLPQANEPANPSSSEPSTPADPSAAPAPEAGPPPAGQGQATAPPSAAAPRSEGSASAVPPGQWVYTEQYGWLWMPYADAYTYVPPGAGDPYMYVYYPAVGWTWLVAPWVWGWGPRPYFGIYAPWRFTWFGHVGHPYAFHSRPHRWHGAFPAPSRGFVRGGVVGVHRGGGFGVHRGGAAPAHRGRR